ncbi:MAG: aa3-type cytochrome c oxidase subunit IV [Phenylobacterium sp.]
MAGPASDYHRGEMDIHEQVSTFNLVMGMTKWGSLILASFLLFIVIWFCTAAGFLSGLVSGAVLLALGIVLLRSKPEAAH